MQRWSAVFSIVGILMVVGVGTGCQPETEATITLGPDPAEGSSDLLTPYEAVSPTGAELTSTGDGPRFGEPSIIEGPALEPLTTGRVHVIEPGETLYSIAVRYYRSGKQWPRILEANKSRISNPRQIPIGTKLIIP